MSLRIVALLTPRPLERATVCDPTGCAVSTYSSTIARRIEAFRSSSSAWSVTVPPGGVVPGCRRRGRDWQSIVSSANSGFGAVAQDPERHFGGQEPTAGREHGRAVGVVSRPSGFEVANGGRRRRPGRPRGCGARARGARAARVAASGVSRPGHRRLAGADALDVTLGQRRVPGPRPGGRVVTVRGGADGDAVGAGPVALVVAALVARPRPVRHLVPVEPACSRAARRRGGSDRPARRDRAGRSRRRRCAVRAVSPARP